SKKVLLVVVLLPPVSWGMLPRKHAVCLYLRQVVRRLAQYIALLEIMLHQYRRETGSLALGEPGTVLRQDDVRRHLMPMFRPWSDHTLLCVHQPQEAVCLKTVLRRGAIGLR